MGDKYHPGYFGKVGMRTYHLKRNKSLPNRQLGQVGLPLAGRSAQSDRGQGGRHRRWQAGFLQSLGQRSLAQAADDRQGEILQRSRREEDQGSRRNLHSYRLKI